MRKAVVLLLFIGFWSSVAAQSGRVTTEIDKSRPRQVGNAPQETPIPNAPQNQTPKPNPEKAGDSDEVLKIETALVTIPVSVIDRQGHFVTTLRQQDFQIFEDGKPQEVAYFAATEQPITVALLIDVSNSTEFKIGELQDAANAFIKQLKPVDKVLVIAFDEKARVLSEATNDRDQLFKAIRRAKFHGGTSLYDAVDFAINRRLSQIQGRKAIVLFTDGVDSTSRTGSFQSTLAAAEEFDATVFTIHYDTYNPEIDDGKTGYGVTREEYAAGADYVKELADKTGGKLYEADSTRNLENAFFNIAEELRWQYNLGYYPLEAGKAGDRKQIKVRVNLQNIAVHARDNYVVGQQEKKQNLPK
ncbi:MAG: VWA domain-containing protein [Pyrinomonadaceae bacterium]